MRNKIFNTLKNNKRWILLLICIVIFIIILANINKIGMFDTYIYKIISSIKTNTVTNFFKIITTLGSAKVLIGITFILLIILKNKKVAIYIAINLIVVGFINQSLKLIVKRPRPDGYRLIYETGYSFPSGHSMASMAFYGLIIYFVFKNVKNKPIKICTCVALSLLIIFIGISRIYLGVHYASDVIAGFILTIAYLMVYITIVKKVMKNE